jgi:hypothetical protein
MFLLKSIHDWASLAKSWIDAPINLLVIHYENLVDSTLSELKKILNFLDIDDFRLNTECFQVIKPYKQLCMCINMPLVIVIYRKAWKVLSIGESPCGKSRPLFQQNFRVQSEMQSNM